MAFQRQNVITLQRIEGLKKYLWGYNTYQQNSHDNDKNVGG
jgi:hypothetical protein